MGSVGATRFRTFLGDGYTDVTSAGIDVLFDEVLDVRAEAPVTEAQATVVGRLVEIGGHRNGDLGGTVIHEKTR